MKNKVSIRKDKLKERDSLTAKYQNEVEKTLIDNFLKYTKRLNLKKVGLYSPVRNEVPTNGIRKILLNSKINCYLPIISKSLECKKMKFGLFSDGKKLKKNRYGIKEPTESTQENIEALNLVLIPVVAFDNKGYRIGMGEGFYDYTLENLSNNKNIKILGIAYDFQKVKSCFPEDHDVKLNAVISPSGIIIF